MSHGSMDKWVYEAKKSKASEGRGAEDEMWSGTVEVQSSHSFEKQAVCSGLLQRYVASVKHIAKLIKRIATSMSFLTWSLCGFGVSPHFSLDV